VKGYSSVITLLRQGPPHIRLGILFLSGFGSGFSPLAPGTSATLFAWGGIHMFHLPSWAWGTIGGGIFLLATFLLSSKELREFARNDSPWIVADEISAFYIAIGILSPQSFGGESIIFLFFRLADALKPPPLRWLERIPAPFGVMLDDLGAAGWTIALILGARLCGF